jgi:hypothetical protein
LTAQGHPRAIFNRAIERGNLLVAEATLRELGRPSLLELLELTLLIAEKDSAALPESVSPLADSLSRATRRGHDRRCGVRCCLS